MTDLKRLFEEAGLDELACQSCLSDYQNHQSAPLLRKLRKERGTRLRELQSKREQLYRLDTILAQLEEDGTIKG